MAKLILVSADDTRARQMLALAQQAETRRQPQLVCVDPTKALSTPGLIHATDFVVLQADEFDMDVLERLRQRFPEPGDVPCILVTPQPSTELLMRAMRMGVRSVLRWPLDPREFNEELTRLDTRAEAEATAQARTFAFTSCKGGSGTTFAAANFAYAVAAQRGKRVLLVDLDQQFGDAAFVVTDNLPPATLGDICRQIDRLDAALLDACVTHAHPNLDVIAGAGDPVKSADVKAAHLERILDLAKPAYDVLVFDLGQAINPASIMVLDHCDTIHPVVQLSLPYLRAGRHMMEIFHSLGYPAERMQVVLNQFEKHAAITIRTMEDSLGTRIAHMLPPDAKTAREAANQGVPVPQLAPNSAITRALMQMVDAAFPAAAKKEEGLFARLLGNRGDTAQPLPVGRHA
ncbi:nucleotide-binding protein [Cupriavidus pauculus]|uniref:Pilus assembly protein n=1 Tax=Cupriavidus pauculus TaxID=82633 RepID=A0A2N5CJX2_9BURK|nr:AAA family ATPase [Cupriavidus pauculus]PLQ02504.1 pilus assembly protein [Cupriavidus pauculus]